MKMRLVPLAAMVWLGVNFAATSGAVAQANDPGLALKASNDLKLSADTLRSGFFVNKEFIVPHRGVIRVRYQLRHNGVSSASVSVTSSIDPNNSCGASATTSFVTKVCDLKVVAGDRVRVSGSGLLDPFTFMQSTISVRNVRLHWRVVDTTSAGEVLVD